MRSFYVGSMLLKDLQQAFLLAEDGFFPRPRHSTRIIALLDHLKVLPAFLASLVGGASSAAGVLGLCTWGRFPKPEPSPLEFLPTRR